VLDLLYRKRVAGLVTSFFHNSLHALSTSQDMLLAHTAAAKSRCACTSSNENGDASKLRISRAFPSITNSFIIDLSDFSCLCTIASIRGAHARKMWCCAECSNARCSENAGFFVAL
jgi:hypothetical protein